MWQKAFVLPRKCAAAEIRRRQPQIARWEKKSSRPERFVEIGGEGGGGRRRQENGAGTDFVRIELPHISP